jgi:hypothetical protein
MTPRCYWIGDTLWEELPEFDLLRRVWSPTRGDEGSCVLTREAVERALGVTLVAVA